VFIEQNGHHSYDCSGEDIDGLAAARVSA